VPATGPAAARAAQRVWITTLGCPKNEVDSAKLAGRLAAAGYEDADDPGDADLIVVNTCAFIEAAREESVETIMALSEARRAGARLAVTGCLAERSGAELAEALPEIDVVAGFGMDLEPTVPMPPGHRVPTSSPVAFRERSAVPSFDLLELERPASSAPWAYVKVAEGCDRRCGFCAIPSFRGPQRSRPLRSIIAEVERLEVSEVILVAQDLASFGHDRSARHGSDEAGIVELVEAVAEHADWVRLLYLYPSSLTDRLIDTILATGVPYFDLSLQHVSAPLLRRMRRFGNRSRFLERIHRIRELQPNAVLRSSFILGYPGESEEDQDELLGFLREAELDWAGFFTFSREPGTYADGLEDSLTVSAGLALDRLSECAELQEAISTRRRATLVGEEMTVLCDRERTGRSFREAPDIDGVVRLDAPVLIGDFVRVRCTGSEGPDLLASVVGR
jgi:ribosomal protein S12 methylthiotransferase